MYRERIHLTVTDMDGWNEAIDAMAEINKVMERIGQPTATIWTDTVGVFNQLVAEIDYVDLASYEAANKAFYTNEEILKQLPRINHASVQGKGYTELLETTGTI
jgi:hypothetical protein